MVLNNYGWIVYKIEYILLLIKYQLAAAMFYAYYS